MVDGSVTISIEDFQALVDAKLKASETEDNAKKGDTVMIDPRTEAVKCRLDSKDMLLVGEHQLLGKF